MFSSTLTFSDLCEGLPYIFIEWNNKVIYDEISKDESIEALASLLKIINNKIIYSMQVEVTQFHHLKLFITGEKIDWSKYNY